MNQHQQLALDYLREENRVLKEQLGGSRLRLNDDQRRRLASKAKRLGRRLLAQVATIVTPETLLDWHRKLIARSTTEPHIAHRDDLVRPERSRLWWCEWQKRTGIGAMGESRVHYPTGHELARSTITQILEQHGLERAPERSRKTTWKEFLSRHWELIVATDFFTVEVWTP